MSAITDRLALLLPLFYPGTIAKSKPPNSVAPGASKGEWVILPGPGTENDELTGEVGDFGGGKGAFVDVRTYNMLYLSGALGSGGPGDLVARCEPVVDPDAGWKIFFRARPMLSDPGSSLLPLLGIVHSKPLEDAGVAGIDWAGTTYIGVTCQLEIHKLAVYTFVTGE